MALRDLAQPSRDSGLDALPQSMADIISSRVNGTADWPTPIPNLNFFRRDEPAEPCICLVEPSVVLVVQGAKEMLVAGESCRYDKTRFLVTSLDLPANSGVLTASPEAPCLGERRSGGDHARYPGAVQSPAGPVG